MDSTDLRQSDLAIDSRIDVEFDGNITYRYTVQSRDSAGRHVRRKQRKDAWQLEKILGKNVLGEISLYKCMTSEGPGELQAVKRVNKAAVDENDYFEELGWAVKLSQKRYEGLLVDFLGWYESNDSFFIAMEYIEYGSLESHLKGPLPEKDARQITLQIAEGLEVLHEDGFYHEKLNPAQIFVFQKSPDWWVKIGNLCFANPVDSAGLKSEMDIPGFLPPEIVFPYPEIHCKERINIWALGLIVFYMVHHHLPSFTSSSTILQKYVQGEFEIPLTCQPFEIGEDCQDFIERLMAPRPANRLFAKEAMQHVWLRPTEFPHPILKEFKITERRFPAAIQSEKKNPETLKLTSKESVDRSTEEGNEEGDVSSECSEWHTAEDGSEGEDQSNSKSEETPFFHSPDYEHRETTSQRYKNRSHGFFLVSPYNQGLQFFRGDELQESELQAIHNEGVSLCNQKTEWKRAEIMLQTAAEKREELFGLEHQYTHDSYRSLGELYYYMGKLAEAEIHFRLILEPQAMYYGWRHPSTMKSEYWLGVLEMRGGRYEKGQATLKSVMKKQASSLGSFHPDTMRSVCESKWLPPRYAKMLESTLEMKGTIDVILKGKPFEHPRWSFRWIIPHQLTLYLYGPLKGNLIDGTIAYEDRQLTTIPEIHYWTAAALGMILYTQRNFEKARGYLINAVNGLYEAVHEPNADFLHILYLHGHNELEHGQRYDIAEEIFREVIDEQLLIGSLHNMKNLHLFNALASALIEQKKWADATTILRRASNAWAAQPMPDDYDEDKVMFHLLFGRVLYMLNCLEEAERHYLRAFKLTSDRFMDDKMYQPCLQLGKFLFRLKKYSESEKAFLKAMRSAWNSIKDLSEGSYWLAKTMCEQERYAEAENLFQFALDERNMRLGKDDMKTVDSAYWLGYTHYHTKRYAEAEVRLYQALVGWKKTPGDSDSRVRLSLDLYAKSLQAQRKDELAQKAYIELLKFESLNFGREREQTLKTMTCLAGLFEAQGKVAEASVLFTEVWDRTKYWGSESVFHREAAANMYRTRSQFLKELSSGIA